MVRLVLVASVVSGCVFRQPPEEPPPVCGDGERHYTESCDDGNTATEDGCDASCRVEHTEDFSWTVTSLATSQNARCPAGFDTAVVSIERCLNESCKLELQSDCANGTLRWYVTDDIPFFTFESSVRFENSTTGEVYGESTLIDNVPGDPPPHHVIYEDAGFVQFKLLFERDDLRVNCFDIPINNVRITATPLAGGADIVFDDPCSSPFDSESLITTPPMQPGSYSLRLDTEAASRSFPNLVVDPHDSTSLGVVTLEFP